MIAFKHLISNFQITLIGNGDVVDNVDLMGMASRLSHQSDLRPATADRGHSSRYYKSKKSYDQALSTLAATLPLVSGRRRSSLTHRDTRQISTAPRGRRGSRTIGRKYDIPTVNNSGTS